MQGLAACNLSYGLNFVEESSLSCLRLDCGSTHISMYLVNFTMLLSVTWNYSYSLGKFQNQPLSCRLSGVSIHLVRITVVHDAQAVV